MPYYIQNLWRACLVLWSTLYNLAKFRGRIADAIRDVRCDRLLSHAPPSPHVHLNDEHNYCAIAEEERLAGGGEGFQLKTFTAELCEGYEQLALINQPAVRPDASVELRWGHLQASSKFRASSTDG